jgi:hypothetical protein
MQTDSSMSERWETAKVSPLEVFGTISILVIFQLPLGRYLAPGNTFGAQMGGEGVFWGLTLRVVSEGVSIE